MSNKREALKQIQAKSVAKQTGVGSLPRSIHRTPGLREWVTLESLALPPIPVKRDKIWQLISLLTVEQKLDDGTREWLAPWGAIAWSWPDQMVIQKIDLRKHSQFNALRKHSQFNALRQQSKIKLPSADNQVAFDPQSRTLRENDLFRALDELVSSGIETPDFSSLAGYYAGLLPPEIYPYYHLLIPESIEWLRPNISAHDIEKSDPLTATAVFVEQNVEIESSTSGDLSDRIESWLGQSWQITNFIEDIKTKNQLIKSLQAIELRATLPGFRLAFVGEFSRGKSSLINRILERELLPVGTLPTTATLTSIVAGAKEQMEVTLTKERKELRSLEESSWNDLLATDTVGSDQELFNGVYITVNHDWLRELDIELIDTPGANDLNSRRSAVVFDLLNQCDAVVLVVRADAPMSMTEIGFLEAEIIGRHVPRIIVVVSHLDRVIVDERSQVMDVICRRVHQIAASIAVLPAYPIENNTTEAECLTLLRSQIAAMVAKGNRQIWRNRQIAGQLTTYLSQILQIGKQAIATVKMSETERQQVCQKAQKKLSKADLDWDVIQNQLERRRIECDRALRQKLHHTKTDLIELLLLELNKIPNPKLWWERDLPWRLRRELTALNRKSEEFVMQTIAQDFEWLQTETYRIFGIKISAQITQNLEKTQINTQIPDVEINNIQQYRLLTRLGTTTAMICSYLLPIVSTVTGLVVSTTGGILSEQFLNKKLEEQRQILSQILNQSIDTAIAEYCTQVSQRLRKLYNQLSTDMKQEQTQWLLVQKLTLQPENQIADQTTWQPIINQASALKSEIITALSIELNE